MIGPLMFRMGNFGFSIHCAQEVGESPPIPGPLKFTVPIFIRHMLFHVYTVNKRKIRYYEDSHYVYQKSLISIVMVI